MFRKTLLALVMVSSPLFGADPVTERPTGPSSQPTRQTPVNPNPANPAPAPVENRSISLPGSLWIGTEEVNNNGRLEFGLLRNGTAIMVDAQSRIEGRWTTQGNEVVVTFKNCVYRGTIRGNDFIGRASITEGNGVGQSWAFRITHVNPYAGLTFTGTENLNGYGSLAFRFDAVGSVVMTDARTDVRGTYTYDVGTITIRFQDCEYIGTIQPGNVLAGTARFTNANPNQAGPWTFSVRLK